MAKYNSDFKAKVALEAIKEDETLGSLSSKYGIHVRQIQMWKSEALKGLSSVFNNQKNKEKKMEEEFAALERKIGQLTIENDFLKKNSLKLQR